VVENVIESVLKSIDGSEVRRVPFDEKIVEGIFDVSRKLQGIVPLRPEVGHLHAELILQFLPGLEDFHDALHDDVEDLPKVAGELRRNQISRQTGTDQELGQFTRP
jgi:hypothetical protein